MRSLFFLLLLVSCQIKTQKESSLKLDTSSIIRGEKTNKEEDKDLYYSSVGIPLYQGACTGVLISRNVVLTAAHCVDVAKSSPSHIYMGDTLPIYVDVRHEERRYDIDRIIVHPEFSEDYSVNKRNSDLALLILKDDVRSPFKPMKIYSDFDYGDMGSPIIVAGFSSHSEPQKNNIYDLLENHFTGSYNWSNFNPSSDTISLLTRKTILMTDDMLDEDHMIYSQVAGGICAGDSGGPTMIKRGDEMFLIGINRSVNGRGKNKVYNCEYIGYSTSALAYKDWIDSVLMENGAELPEYSLAEVDIDLRELNCGNLLSGSLNLYKILFESTSQDCGEYAQYNIAKELKRTSDDCFESCRGIKGFKGQCEFFEKGRKKMLSHYENLCPKGI